MNAVVELAQKRPTRYRLIKAELVIVDRLLDRALAGDQAAQQVVLDTLADAVRHVREEVQP